MANVTTQKIGEHRLVSYQLTNSTKDYSGPSVGPEAPDQAQRLQDEIERYSSLLAPDPPKPVRFEVDGYLCVTTGQWFENIKIAAATMGASPFAIFKAVERGTKTRCRVEGVEFTARFQRQIRTVSDVRPHTHKRSVHQ